MNPQLYTVIDCTTVETTRILYLAELRQAQCWGTILQAEGRKIIAPALSGAAFSKLEHLQLQYLYWNTFGLTPTEDYAQLVRDCRDKSLQMELDTSTLDYLERVVQKLEDQKSVPKPPSAPAQEGQAEAPERPRSSGATKKVWDIADMFMKGGVIPDRKAVIDECVRQGINSSTASTQFSKWRHAYVSANQS